MSEENPLDRFTFDELMANPAFLKRVRGLVVKAGLESLGLKEPPSITN